jgi:hypothetical protein
MANSRVVFMNLESCGSPGPETSEIVIPGYREQPTVALQEARDKDDKN